MAGTFLLRGMLVGIIAGFLCFAFLKIVGEPQVDRAIAFETQMDEAKDQAKADDMRAKGMAMAQEAPEPELVSRPLQAGIGLFTGVMVYSASFGGLFALAFALVYGRLGDFGPRATSALLAGAGFVSLYLVPNMKYTANPPSVGEPDTIGMRTAFYFAMIAISLAAIIGATMAGRRLIPRFGAWNGALMAGGGYLVTVVVAGLLLPTVNEVPAEFPAVVLWWFRVASMGAQFIMWTTIGIVFGALTERTMASQRVPSRLGTATV